MKLNKINALNLNNYKFCYYNEIINPFSQFPILMTHRVNGKIDKDLIFPIDIDLMIDIKLK